jgi:phosphoglycolate phosphatase
MRQFDLIVFDWDGTIVDSTAMIAQCIRSAASDLELAVPTLEQASHVIGLGLRDALSHAVPGLAAHRADEFSARYRHHYLEGERNIVLFNGMRALLEELANGVPLAVATGKTRRGLERAFEATDLGRLFVASRCADESQSKPHPAMLLELANDVGVAPARMLMVGDTSHDLLMAQAAGVAALGVTYGAHLHAHLASFAPLALVASVAELATWLRVNAIASSRGHRGAVPRESQ